MLNQCDSTYLMKKSGLYRIPKTYILCIDHLLVFIQPATADCLM